MLIITTIIICASIITTLILYNNSMMIEYLRWIASDEIPSAKIDFMDRDRIREKLKYILLVFPSCVILFSILIWVSSLLLNFNYSPT
jgi:hypothetical protein